MRRRWQHAPYIYPGDIDRQIPSGHKPYASTVAIAMIQTFTAFAGPQRLASGALADVALAVKHAGTTPASVTIFDDRTGRTIDLDLRGSDADILARLSRATVDDVRPEPPTSEPRGRGRPKLGVVAREVTLLPRHWEWLARQPGGASVAPRRLVDEARHVHADRDVQRAAREATYRFMTAIAGDLPGFEEATRALFAGERSRFDQLVAPWPADVRDHLNKLASSAWSAA